MAIHTPIISPRHSEAVQSFHPTPVTIFFTAMMHDFAAYIEAERDLEHCGSWDPACDAWIRDAERARSRVLDSLAGLHATPLERHEDQPLKRLGQMVRMLIESDTPESFRNTLALQAYFPDLFRCADTSLTGRRTNLLIMAFQQHLHTLATLSDFTGMVEADYAESIVDEPVTLLAPAA